MNGFKEKINIFVSSINVAKNMHRKLDRNICDALFRVANQIIQIASQIAIRYTRNRSHVYEVRDYLMRWRVGWHTQHLWCNCLVCAACPLPGSLVP